MHLDLYTDDQAAEVERLAAVGATVVRHNRDPEDDYVVMTDPEGNEFCVCAVPESALLSSSPMAVDGSQSDRGRAEGFEEARLAGARAAADHQIS